MYGGIGRRRGEIGIGGGGTGGRRGKIGTGGGVTGRREERGETDENSTTFPFGCFVCTLYKHFLLQENIPLY